MAFRTLHGQLDSSLERHRWFWSDLILLWAFGHNSIWIFGVEQKVRIFETNLEKSFAGFQYHRFPPILGFGAIVKKQYGKFEFFIMPFTSWPIFSNYWVLLLRSLYILFEHIFIHI